MLAYSYSSYPTPHIYLPQLLPPDLYARISFPNIKVRAKGRSGRDLFVGEPGWSEAIASDGFRELYSQLTSPEFVSFVLSVFEQDMKLHRSRVDAKRARLVPILETREMLDAAPEVLDETADANELFNRFDFTVAGGDYTAYVHLDSPRRLVGGVLFFSDAEQEGLQGGEFTLYRDLLFGDDRNCHWPLPVKKFPVKGNTGVLFLNSNRGFHGPSEITQIHGVRRWIYYSISSRNRVWEEQRPPRHLRVIYRALGRLGIRPGPGINPKSKLDANKVEESTANQVERL
jgi:hypothetical protein